MQLKEQSRDLAAAKRERIAERLRELLAEHQLTQREFARRTGLQESYLSKILAADANLSLATICAIEEAIGDTILDVRLDRLQKGSRVVQEAVEDGLFFFMPQMLTYVRPFSFR